MDVFQRAQALRQRPHDQIPEFLYHYTSAAGIIGILQTRRLWFTHFEYLNDRLEGHYFLEAVRRWSGRSRGRRNQPWVGPLLERGLELLRPFGTPYVLSLSEQSDSLSQWRAYGADGLGYALGFHGTGVVGLERTEDRPATIGRIDAVPVVYDTARQDAMLDAFTEEAVRATEPEFAMAMSMIVTVLFAPVFKHHAFEGEREWRVIVAGHGLEMGLLAPDIETARWVDGMAGILRFRSSLTQGVTPYLDLPHRLVPLLDHLAAVQLGPRIAPHEGGRAIKMLLTATGVDSATVALSPSQAPYR